MKTNEFTWSELMKSERFWAMVLAALSVYLSSKGWIGEAERNLIATITTGFAVIRTYDRGKEKEVEAAKIMNK